MTVLDALLGSSIRGEMKRRVDQVLKAGHEWTETAEKLNKTLKELTKAIYEGDAKTVKPIGAPIRKLANQTGKMSKALTNYTKTLSKLGKTYADKK